MHAIFFGLKRAWHGSLRVTRHALAALGLTAARFDLLYAIGKNPIATQRELRLILGVNRTTISRLLGALENLGLLTRTRVQHGDRRTKHVDLTEKGRRRVRIAVGRMIRTGAAKLALDCGLAGQERENAATGEVQAGAWFDEEESFRACGALESHLVNLRSSYGDFATLVYPWHPDD